MKADHSKNSHLVGGPSQSSNRVPPDQFGTRSHPSRMAGAGRLRHGWGASIQRPRAHALGRHVRLPRVQRGHLGAAELAGSMPGRSGVGSIPLGKIEVKRFPPPKAKLPPGMQPSRSHPREVCFPICKYCYHLPPKWVDLPSSGERANFGDFGLLVVLVCVVGLRWCCV